MVSWKTQAWVPAFLFLYKGMEEVKRQFGQHIALEPEWEAGFYLQIQLRHILAMFQDWCSSDVSLVPPLLLNCPKLWTLLPSKHEMDN